ncbi:MAG TPA: DUF72 domain-containing protein [Solirubrobacteraceae bacterium]|jgi:uncharacterized protein YecE (DUF72 family)|nr:DUF72 domain-containing protein [Solirubrobacteraceae bacterium]
MREVHVGCSGWDYADWRAPFYGEHAPKRRWLELYAEHFDTVEVNSTFYRLARPAAVERWLDSTPDGFRFAIKASRYLTHVRRLTDLGTGIGRFYAPLEPLIEADRLGPVLWQLPENFHRDERRLAAWIEALPPGMHTIEFRDPSWFVPSVLELLRDGGVALTIGDHPQRPFQLFQATVPWRFIRFHYGRRGRDGNYSASELDDWAAQIERWRRETEIWAYFNNDWKAFAPANATALMRRLGAAVGV